MTFYEFIKNGWGEIMATDVLQPGEAVDMTIDNVAFGGAGVGRARGMVVFVPFTMMGEEVEVEIRSVRKNFALGQLRRLLKPVAGRSEPVCRYYGFCGGCQLQHMAYEQQLALKENQVGEIFSRLGKCEAPPVRRIIPSPSQLHYRGKADYHIKTTSAGRFVALGFRSREENNILDITRCEIVAESINNSCQALREDLQSGARYGVRERQSIWASLEEGRIIPVPDASGAPPILTRMVKDLQLAVAYDGFFQANTSLVDGLVDQVLLLADMKGGERVLDGYCGAGLFSLFLAAAAGSVLGIDVNGGAVQAARNNLREAGFNNALFLPGDVGRVMKQQLARGSAQADIIILDPPRPGCDRQVLEAVKGMAPTKVIYISCNPTTQARDIRYLVDVGFSLSCLQPIDMFPQTGHIEVIALLQRL